MLWRVHSDAVNIALMARWLPEKRVERLLKTDLFDEAVDDGVYPVLEPKAQNVIGIDVSLLMAKAALGRHTDLKGISADVCCLPFAEKSFDVIVSNSTLDHFKTQDQIIDSLRELYRVLRVDGQLIITLDNLANPVIALRNILPFRSLHYLGVVPYYVGATFRPRRLCLQLRRVGFDPIEITTIMHCPRIFAVAWAEMLERCGTLKAKRRFLRALMAFECLSRWPTRFLTGYFVAVAAIKR